MNRATSFWKSLQRSLRGERYGQAHAPPADRYRLSGKPLKLPCAQRSFNVQMGKQAVCISPDEPGSPHDFLVFDPERYFSGIAQSLRLRPGETLAIDHRQDDQHGVFSHPKDVFRRHLQIRHDGEILVFRDPISELGTYVEPREETPESSLLLQRRKRYRERIRTLYGGAMNPLDQQEALATIQAVNRQMRNDPYREHDSLGNPGSLLEPPSYLTPIIVGDLHACVDNLLTLLCENSFLDALEQGKAFLLFLGDAVHSEEKGFYDRMESSLLIMDLILKLKQQFPDRVFFVQGNHDSFSPDVMKGGVAQSVLWERYLREQRGEAFVEEMSIFYRQSPLLVISRDFIACHAGPPRNTPSRKMLIEARQFPELVHELTWNRVKSTQWPMGYTKGDVKRLRKALGKDETLPFIVAHYPQDATETLWLNVGNIPGHHIVYSARTSEVAVYTRIEDRMVPQRYPVHPLQDTI